MQQQLINHNPEIKKLQDKGYNIKILDGQYLLVHQVPYVNIQKEVKHGILVCVLTLISPTKLGKPKDHTIYFCGETPCDFEGEPLNAIINNSKTRQLTPALTVNHYFSSKPASGKYDNYFDKISTYMRILSANAEQISKLKN